jgi:hypothetical protein
MTEVVENLAVQVRLVTVAHLIQVVHLRLHVAAEAVVAAAWEIENEISQPQHLFATCTG